MADTDLERLAPLAEPVRRRLYELVAASPEPVDRDRAAEGAGIARPLAAFHLDRLVDAGLLDVEYRRRSGRTGPGAGRPAKFYRRRTGVDVAVSLPPRHYEVAAEILAEGIERSKAGRAEVLAAAADRGRQLAAAARPPRAGRGGDLPRSPGEGLAVGRAASQIERSAGPRSAAEPERSAEPEPSREPERSGKLERSAEPDRDRLVGILRAEGYEPFVAEDGALRLRNCPFHALVGEHRELTCSMNLALLGGVAEGFAAGLRPIADPRPGTCCVAFVAEDPG